MTKGAAPKQAQSSKADEGKARKAGSRHRYVTGPMRKVEHHNHSIAFWRKHPDLAKCPGCDGFHLIPAGEWNEPPQ